LFPGSSVCRIRAQLSLVGRIGLLTGSLKSLPLLGDDSLTVSLSLPGNYTLETPLGAGDAHRSR